MSDTGEVGAAMWGGRHLVAAPPEESAPEPPTPARRGIDRELLSVALVGLAVPALVAGAWLLWGPGGGLLAFGLMLLIVGVLLGVGER